MRALSGLVGGAAASPLRIGALPLIKLKGVCGRASMRGPGDGIFRAVRFARTRSPGIVSYRPYPPLGWRSGASCRLAAAVGATSWDARTLANSQRGDIRRDCAARAQKWEIDQRLGVTAGCRPSFRQQPLFAPQLQPAGSRRASRVRRCSSHLHCMGNFPPQPVRPIRSSRQFDETNQDRAAAPAVPK